MDRGELWRISSHVSGDSKASEKATNRPSYCAFNHSRLEQLKGYQVPCKHASCEIRQGLPMFEAIAVSLSKLSAFWTPLLFADGPGLLHLE